MASTAVMTLADTGSAAANIAAIVGFAVAVVALLWTFMVPQFFAMILGGQSVD